MRDSVTQEEIAFYQENGFVVLEGLLDRDEVAEWRRVIEHALTARASRLPLEDTQYDEFFHSVDEYYDRVFTQKINLWMTDAGARELVLDQRLGRVAADLAGVDGVRIWLDQALVKEPYANPTAFHIDVPFWSFHSNKAITIWVALSDATLTNGCLCYIPGSHKTERYDNAQIGNQIGSLFDIYPQWKHVQPVFCPVSAGSAVAHNGLTAHGAGANMTPERRFAMTIAYMPDGATYNGKQDILAKELAEKLSIGDPLNDERQNPLVFSRSQVVAAG
jgi:phytanoyl-CoA hydroxylase